MAVNVKKNEGALQAAYQDVLKDSSDTDWAVFGYEGNSNDLKVVETGDGGLEELVDEMNGGKILYAFLRVKDPNTELPKNVLINWQGGGVPANRKGVCARHTTDVARYFRGAHVTVNARSEMDLEEDSIMDKVAKASGANFGFHKEKTKAIPEQGPVGSVYKRADPKADINARSRDQFWAKQEQDEVHRKVTEKKAAAEERRDMELSRRQNEAEQATERERAAEERGRTLEEQRRQEKQRHAQELSAKEEALQQRLKQEESAVEAERQREKEESHRQRVQEYKSISSAVGSKKAGFEQPEEEPPLPQRPPKKSPMRRPVPVPEPEPEPEPEPYPEPEPEPEPYPEPEPEPYPEPEPEPYPEPEPEPEPEQEWEAEPEQPLYDDVEQAQEPDQPLYDDVQENLGYQKEEPEQQLYDDVKDEVAEAEPLYQEATDPTGGAGSLTAVTVFDYQAEDDTELTFDEDERIINIEKIDDGWWRGTRELDGSTGIFPANYVELI